MLFAGFGFTLVTKRFGFEAIDFLYYYKRSTRGEFCIRIVLFS